MGYLDAFILLAYVAYNLDIILQIRRIYRTKSSYDLSIIGMTARFAAINIILVKFISISESALIIGQGFVVATYLTYITLALHYARFRKPLPKKPLKSPAKAQRRPTAS